MLLLADVMPVAFSVCTPLPRPPPPFPPPDPSRSLPLPRANNCLTDAPVPITVPSMLSLEWLSLAGNRITALTEEMKALRSLQHLDVSRNCLREFPGWLGQLTTLRTLNLSHNRLREMPLEFEGLNGLLTLDLSSNALTRLPEGMASAFASLRHLLLYNNHLAYLPTTMAPLLKQLATFDCSRNRLLVRRGECRHAVRCRTAGVVPWQARVCVGCVRAREPARGVQDAVVCTQAPQKPGAHA